MICCWCSLAVSDSPSAAVCESARRHRDPCVSAALIHSQTPTWLNSINPQRSLATFAPMLASCFTEERLCNGSLWKRRSTDGAAAFTAEAPESAGRGKWTANVGPSDEACWRQLQTVGSARSAAWLLNSERLSTLDTRTPPHPPPTQPPSSLLMTNQNEKWRRGRAWKSLICSAC